MSFPSMEQAERGSARKNLWTIEADIRPLAAISGHLYISVFNDAGVLVEQFNGLAASPGTEKKRVVGLPGDILKAYTLEQFSFSGKKSAQNVIFSGSEKEVRKAIEVAYEKIDGINALNLPYQVFSQNSNSVFVSIVEAMAREVPVDQGRVRAIVQSKLLLPGHQKRL